MKKHLVRVALVVGGLVVLGVVLYELVPVLVLVLALTGRLF